MRIALRQTPALVLFEVSVLAGIAAQAQVATWDAANPVQPLPASPLGIDSKLTDLKQAPTPQRVRLGRWLFYDKRLSADGTIACATCHAPEHAFSELTPVSTGIRGQKGGRL
jgi:cytochrome c peroxidase